MKILLVAAMPTESEDIVSLFQLKEAGKIANFYSYYSTHKDNHEITLLQTHVGSINAPAAVALALEKEKPDVVIKVGCIGGNAPGIKRNDIIVPTLYFHTGAWMTRSYIDNVPTNDAGLWQSLYGDKPYQNSSENLGGLDFTFLPDSKLTNAYKNILNEENIKYTEAPIGSGDMVILDHALMENVRTHILKLTDPKAPWCSENESYAVAQVCTIFKIPFTGVYFIASSDYEDIDGYDPKAIRIQTQKTILPIVEKLIASL